MSYELITTEEGVRRVCQCFANAPAVGLDFETTSFTPRDGVIRLIQISDGIKTFIIDLFKLGQLGQLEPLKQFLRSPRPRKVIHNSKFEHIWVENYLGGEIQGVFDTYLGAKLVRMHEDCKLDEVINYYLNIEISKEEQTSDWSIPELSESQLIYAARDAVHLPKLRELIIKDLYQDDLLKTAEIEFNAAATVGDIEMAGFPVNPEMYELLCKQLEKIRDEKEHALRKILGSALGQKAITIATQAGLFGDEFDKTISDGEDINLRSHVQIKKAFAALGVDLPSTGKLVIESLVHKHPELKYLTEFRAAEKLISSYGWNIIKAIDSKTGRIHANFWQLGTDTGRFACKGPNIQQVPHGLEFRECFRPKAGRKFIICDYSLIELRILAHLSRDPVMCKAFREGLDIHSVTAHTIFKLTCDIQDVKKLFKDLRDLGKRVNFGVVYGVGARKFALNVGIPESEAKSHIKGFYTLYSGVSDYLENIEEIGVKNQSVRTLAGRLIKFRFDSSDMKQVSKIRRNSRNSPIQGLTGDILKTALPKMREKLRQYNNARIVNIVHDETVVECDEDQANDVAYHVENEMLKAATSYITEVPVLAEISIGDSWASK